MRNRTKPKNPIKFIQYKAIRTVIIVIWPLSIRKRHFEWRYCPYFDTYFLWLMKYLWIEKPIYLENFCLFVFLVKTICIIKANFHVIIIKRIMFSKEKFNTHQIRFFDCINTDRTIKLSLKSPLLKASKFTQRKTSLSFVAFRAWNNDKTCTNVHFSGPLKARSAETHSGQCSSRPTCISWFGTCK